MIKTISDEYVYKREVDWSLFNYGFAIPIEHQVVFSQVAGRFIQRGESKDVNLYLNGKSYKAKLNNNRIDKKFGPHADIVQIRYTQNSDLAQALRGCFQRSYAYISKIDYSGSPAHLGRSLEQLDRASAHLIQSAFRHMPIADRPIY